MMNRVMAAMLVAVMGAAAPAVAQEYQPSFRPETMTDRPAGRPNEILVLATPHLSALPPAFKPELMEPLLDRLAAWRPSAIASENSSGLLCDALRRQGERQAASVQRYCPVPTVAGRAAGLDVQAANAEAERMLSDWPDSPTPSARRRLALVFLAAGEPVSALVQWFRLPTDERRAADGLTAELVAELERLSMRRSEDNFIVARLAARVGLERM